MRILGPLLAMLPGVAMAQDLPRTMLWKVEGNGLQRPAYVVGTIHSADARAFRDVPRLLALMKGVDAVVGELDLSKAQDQQMHLMAQDLMMPGDTELADFYTKREMDKVARAIAEHLGPMAALANKLKPFILAGILGSKALPADSAMVLDQYLQAAAQKMGKEVMGLETPGEQLAAVGGLPLREQADQLYDLVRHDLYRKELGRMLDAYAAQDLDRLRRMVAKGGLPKEFNARLLTSRNRVMVQRMDSLLHLGRGYFFAVGAAHLAGGDGVLNLLKHRGYTVQPMVEAGPRTTRREQKP